MKTRRNVAIVTEHQPQPIVTIRIVVEFFTRCVASNSTQDLNIWIILDRSVIDTTLLLKMVCISEQFITN